MPLILCNDDGVHAEGLATLHAVLLEFADCLVVAPSGPRSGVGHAVTTEVPMQLEELGPGRYGLSGNPADCARVALARQAAFAREELGDSARAPDLWLVSGINHGANLGVDTYISGTAAAAREAAILGYSAIAMSQYAGRHRPIDWSATARRARRVFEHLRSPPAAPGHLLEREPARTPPTSPPTRSSSTAPSTRAPTPSNTSAATGRSTGSATTTAAPAAADTTSTSACPAGSPSPRSRSSRPESFEAPRRIPL